MKNSLKHAGAALVLGLALAAAGCSTVGSTAPGTTIGQVQASHGSPTAVYPRPDGGQRLEYGSGPWGLHAWMLDFDAGERLLAATQVRDERSFGALHEGMSRDDVLYRIGHPSNVRYLPRQNHDLWSYNYDNPFCLWFQVSVDRQTHRVAGTGHAIHPRCVWDRR